MRLFDGNPYNGHQRMKRASPNFLDDVLDVQALYETAGIEHDKIRDGITGITDAVIIPWANEDQIAAYERVLRISYAGDEMPPLDYRRAEVAARFIGLQHFGRPEILGICSVFVPGQNSEVSFDVEGPAVVGVLVDGYIANEDGFLNLLRQKIPTHLPLQVTVRITRTFRWEPGFGVAGGTEGHLAAQPVDVRYKERRELAVHMAGITRSDFTGEPVDVNRHDRQTFNPLQSASTRTAFTAEPVDAYAREEYELSVGQGASVVQSIPSDIPGPYPRTETREIGLGEAAFARTEQTREPVGPPRVSRAIDPEITQHVNRRADVRGAPIDAGPNINRHQAPSPGGAFIVSHISTKRIPE